jgi:hypothetical protein
VVGRDPSTSVVRAHGRAVFVPRGPSPCGADFAVLLLDRSIDDVVPLAVRRTGAAPGDHLRTIGLSPALNPAPAPKIVRDHVLVAASAETEIEIAEGSAPSGGGVAIDENTAEVVGLVSRVAAARSTVVYTRVDVFLTLLDRALAESEGVRPVTGAQKVKKGPVDMGSECVSGADCAAGVCIHTSDGVGRYCSRACSARDRCPAHFRCEQARTGGSGDPPAVQACVET